MILVIASQVDDEARDLVARWPGRSARLLTCADLSRPGWCVELGREGLSTFVAGGRRHRCEELWGVVCLLPWVFEPELVELEPDDRAYAAAEMTAVLRFWLDGLSCPRLNPPSAGCLSGPSWRPERWQAAAAAAGLPTKPLSRSTRLEPPPRATDAPETEAPETEPPEPGSIETVTVLGGRTLGAGPRRIHRQARALARAAGVEMLGVRFERQPGGERLFAGATTFPRIGEAEAEAIYALGEGWRP